MEEQFSMGTKRNKARGNRFEKREEKSGRKCKRGVKISDTFKAIFVDKHLYNVRRKGKKKKKKKRQTSVEDYSV